MQDVSTESAATASPFFPDNLQFWYETKRAFGCAHAPDRLGTGFEGVVD